MIKGTVYVYQGLLKFYTHAAVYVYVHTYTSTKKNNCCVFNTVLRQS